MILGMKEMKRVACPHGGIGFASLFILVALAGCSILPGVGPSKSDFTAAAAHGDGQAAKFALVNLNPAIASTMEKWSSSSLQGAFPAQGGYRAQMIGVGDSVQVVLWEAGGLFAPPTITERGVPGSRASPIPEQIVGVDGAITVPYAGRIPVQGRTPRQVELDIIGKLADQAVNPQVLVTVTKNVANTVSVLGEVTTGARIPLTSRGDRILDVIAAAGGTKAPAHEVFLTLLRGSQTARVPMQAILVNPRENIYVRPGDVITVAREPQTFTAIGATGQNAVLTFDALGISLEQAIGRAGGLNDQRADPGGVFVIRFEEALCYDQLGLARPSTSPASEVPVVYRLDMHDPNSFFVARRFPIRNKDILFVSNSPAAEIQKVGTIISTFLIPGGTIIAVGALTRN
jgi:polysaccharide export outer membrane protein